MNQEDKELLEETERLIIKNDVDLSSVIMVSVERLNILCRIIRELEIEADKMRALADANQYLAKAILKQIDDAPEFLLTIQNDHIREWTDTGFLGTFSPTHKARLVRIEKYE